ncbi:KipI family sensor histidine kinase inhibitor [Agromyces terreus]|uniref:KipI family sensor histidine kinase inhibitor n=1 Tax=Agromyces terreus TaxID=424795 RepID=A0A9X2H5B7_9MICO|nr:allophanate hydrolase subunit 1 [Agromyces terreus]MCP2371072.1 KipI family sensor histidine kinase inhibitor [Agromyces terreus]
MSRRLLPSGEAALLVECDSLDEVLALHDALEAARRPGVVELVPAARTLLVSVDPERMPLESAATWIRRIPAEAGSRVAGAHAETVTIPVVYDGADLAATAASLHVSVEALVARHSGIEWRVAFVGFAPGFGYLVSDEWPFEVPRLDAPRARVPGGSVAVAGAFAGVYPRQSPGGWRLLGRTDAPLWDPAASEPALLAPGRRVRFERA